MADMMGADMADTAAEGLATPEAAPMQIVHHPARRGRAYQAAIPTAEAPAILWVLPATIIPTMATGITATGTITGVIPGTTARWPGSPWASWPGPWCWDAPWHWGYWSYYNPYCTEVIVVDNATIDYSQPIVLAAPAPVPRASRQRPTPALAESEASQLLDASRNAFARAIIQTAMTLVNQAIAKKPNDAVPHEFRAPDPVCHQAVQAGRGGDLRRAVGRPRLGLADALQLLSRPERLHRATPCAWSSTARENPSLPEVRFLLAYHYMSCGHNEAAAAELKEVVRLNPKDQLSAQLLAGLSGDKPAASPAPVSRRLPRRRSARPAWWETGRPAARTARRSPSI